MMKPVTLTIRDLPSDEFFIPVADPRSLAIYRRMLEGPTPEELEETGRWVAQQASEEAADRGRLLTRHVELVAAEAHPVVSRLLVEHAPVEVDDLLFMSGKRLACRACPGEQDEWGVDHPAGFPCPTWKTIDAEAT